ncbi:hypothetical protein ACHAXT_010670 [Thalassiosira profunda]
MALIFMALLFLAHSRRASSFLLSHPQIMSKRPASASTGSGKKAKTQQSLAGFFGTKSSSAESTTAGYKVFCDLDGVLVDFDAGIKKLFNGRGPDELPNQGMMWGAVSKADAFYATLPWMSDGKALWEEIKHLPQIDILTGVPRHNASREQKFAWCTRELGTSVNHVDMAGKKMGHELVNGSRRKNGMVNVITCWSRNKHMECKSSGTHVLIDDRLSLRDAWEQRGGIFIHHTTTERTLSMLREKGILDGKANASKDSEDASD